MTPICFYKLFLISENKNTYTYYINNDRANVIKFMKIPSNWTQKAQKDKNIK